MRQLPQKDDGKETPGAGTDAPARRRPADHRRNRPRDRADSRIRSARALERRVSKDVDRDCDRR